MEKGKLNLIPDQTSQKLEQLYSGLTSEQASLIDKIKTRFYQIYLNMNGWPISECQSKKLRLYS